MNFQCAHNKRFFMPHPSTGDLPTQLFSSWLRLIWPHPPRRLVLIWAFLATISLPPGVTTQGHTNNSFVAAAPSTFYMCQLRPGPSVCISPVTSRTVFPQAFLHWNFYLSWNISRKTLAAVKKKRLWINNSKFCFASWDINPSSTV